MQKLTLKTPFLGTHNEYNQKGKPYPINEARVLVALLEDLLIGKKLDKLLAYGWNGYYDAVIPSKTRYLCKDNLNKYDWEQYFVLVIDGNQFEIGLWAPNHYQLSLNMISINNIVDASNVPESQLENLWVRTNNEYLDISHIFKEDAIGQKVKKVILTPANYHEYEYLENVIIELENGTCLQIEEGLDNPVIHVINGK